MNFIYYKKVWFVKFHNRLLRFQYDSVYKITFGDQVFMYIGRNWKWCVYTIEIEKEMTNEVAATYLGILYYNDKFIICQVKLRDMNIEIIIYWWIIIIKECDAW